MPFAYQNRLHIAYSSADLISNAFNDQEENRLCAEERREFKLSREASQQRNFGQAEAQVMQRVHGVPGTHP